MQSASADLMYRVAHDGASRVVNAVPPFNMEQRLTGYIDISFEARSSGNFYARRPVSNSSWPIPPVLDFSFSIGGFEWTPIGDHGVLGHVDWAGRITDATLGFERDACGDFTPCFMDITTSGDGRYDVKIYQPGDTLDPPVIAYQAEGLEIVLGP